MTDQELITAVADAVDPRTATREWRNTVKARLSDLGWREAARYSWERVWLDQTGAPALVRHNREWCLQLLAERALHKTSIN